MMNWHKNQKGTAFLELAVGLAIVALIGTGTVGLIKHEFNSTATARACVTIADEIEYAARCISKDGIMAEETNLVVGAAPTDTLTLSWVQRYEFINVPHTCSYYLSGDELCRNYDGEVTTVARYISGIKFSKSGDVISVSIKCTPPWVGQYRVVEKTYSIYPRVDEVEG